MRAVAKGLVAAGIEAGDRVALISKTRYEWTLVDYAIWFAGAVDGAGLRDLLAPSRSSGSSATPAPAPWSPRRPSTPRGSPSGDRLPESLNHVWSLEDNAIEVLRRLGAGHLRRRPRGSGVRRRRRSTWPPSSTPPAPPAGPRAACSPTATSCSSSGVAVARARTSCSTPDGRLDPAVPAAGPRLRPDHPGRLRQGAGPARPHAPTSSTCSTDLAGFQPTFILAVPRVFEKVFNTASQRADRRGTRRHLRPRRRHRDRLLPGARQRAGPGWPLRARHARLRPAGLRQAARRARRPLPRTPSPAARRSATGSATSTAASASSSSRATASPRRRRR